ncbi:hypothetical protein PTTG_00964 [Puccinia triticina 1-1 BBBD Race 1]|uniref:Uncharacterized protein n=2 Tax=Puccinia triticina TaxID=208348 RepID=A0A180GVY7_PUCT1|nr:uncharacterized protein PtA15_3A715 [Puccinia triticina]OAV96508.1 hypothetical protein PTTG_00964 [Puccinia triticina 1-1 BBBD Race 1]WAQ83345.1 hypothetical protein PtA15_3A715 [Puccinia triticina]
MNLSKNTENHPAPMASQSSRNQPANRYPSASPSPVPIRKSRPLQALNSNQVSRRTFGDENKENYRADSVSQRPTGNGKMDPTSVLLQPPTHASLSAQVRQSQPASQPLVPKPSIQQVQLGSIPNSTQWAHHPVNDPLHFVNVDNTLCHTTDFFPSSFLQGEVDGPEADPFSKLSARTLALMDQPESEVTVYDCEYCDKTYQGKHARSIWRRHLSDKHKIPLSTQPRRTRWDNDVNRPKTEEERRERTLESKRRWARKNRAAKKAARDGQRNSMEHVAAVLHSRSLSHNLATSTPDRSRAPSPSMYPSSFGHRAHTAAGSPEFFASVDSHAYHHSLQGNHGRSSVPIMPRDSSVPHTFSHGPPPMSSHSSLPWGHVPFNPSFPIRQATAPAEWSFQPAAESKPSSYSFGNYSAPPDTHSLQFSERFANEANQSCYSPHSSQNQSLRQSPPATYETEVSHHSELAHPPELPDPYPSAPLNFQYHSWELSERFNFAPAVPSPPLERLSYESHAKRPRLSLPSPGPMPMHQYEDLGQTYATCDPEALMESHSFQQVNVQDLSISSSEALQLETKSSSVGSARDQEAESEYGSFGEQRISSQDELNNTSYHTLESPPYTNRQQDVLEGHPRPATAGTFAPLVDDHEYTRLGPLDRAATEPQFSGQHDDLQTPLRESGLRSDGRFHFSHSPMGRMDAPGLDPADLLSSPAVSRPDVNAISLCHGHYAPMSAGKRRSSESHHVQPSSQSSHMNQGDWNNQVLQTPSGLSRFTFSNGMVSSPAGGAGLFGSPHNLLSRSLGLTLPSTGASGEDCLGGLLVGSPSWDVVHRRA